MHDFQTEVPPHSSLPIRAGDGAGGNVAMLGLIPAQGFFLNILLFSMEYKVHESLNTDKWDCRKCEIFGI